MALNVTSIFGALIVFAAFVGFGLAIFCIYKGFVITIAYVRDRRRGGSGLDVQLSQFREDVFGSRPADSGNYMKRYLIYALVFILLTLFMAMNYEKF